MTKLRPGSVQLCRLYAVRCAGYVNCNVQAIWGFSSNYGTTTLLGFAYTAPGHVLNRNTVIEEAGGYVWKFLNTSLVCRSVSLEHVLLS